MGTRAIVIIADDGQLVGCAHRASDGYPGGATAGHAAALLEPDPETGEPPPVDDAAEALNERAAEADFGWRTGWRARYQSIEPRIDWDHQWIYAVDLATGIMVISQEPERVLSMMGLTGQVALAEDRASAA